MGRDKPDEGFKQLSSGGTADSWPVDDSLGGAPDLEVQRKYVQKCFMYSPKSIHFLDIFGASHGLIWWHCQVGVRKKRVHVDGGY